MNGVDWSEVAWFWATTAVLVLSAVLLAWLLWVFWPWSLAVVVATVVVIASHRRDL